MSHPNLKFNVWHQVRDYAMIVLGLLFYALGFSAFVLPEKVVTGGVIGLASLFHFGEIPIPELKKYLNEKNIPVRL